MIMTLHDRLFLAPIEDPKQILDVGELHPHPPLSNSDADQALRDWHRHMGDVRFKANHPQHHLLIFPPSDIADKFPSANVIGTDLSPIQPGQQPSNVTFEIDDCCSDWIYPESHFDFVHLRGLFGSIADWPAFYSQAFKHIKPGGYIEQVEWSVHNRCQDGRLSPNGVLSRWSSSFVEAGTRSGKTFEIAENMAGLVREAGFIDVSERRFKWPVGPWSSDPKMKEIGRWNLLNWDEGMEGWAMAAFTRVLGVSSGTRIGRIEAALLT